MNIEILAIRDHKINTFMTPFTAVHLGQALRSWEELVNDPKTTIAKYPNDFCLYRLGHFDDDSGQLTSLPVPEMIASASDYIKDKNPGQGKLKLEESPRAQA